MGDVDVVQTLVDPPHRDAADQTGGNDGAATGSLERHNGVAICCNAAQCSTVIPPPSVDKERSPFATRHGSALPRDASPPKERGDCEGDKGSMLEMKGHLAGLDESCFNNQTQLEGVHALPTVLNPKRVKREIC